MKVILDTSGWYSFVSIDDRFHKTAVNFVNKKSFFIVLYPVLEELAAILHHRKGKKYTLETLEVLKDTNIGKILYLDNRQDAEIWKKYKSTKNSIDYVDSSVIWLSKKLNLPVFGFDKHFKDIGVDLIPR